MRSKRKTVTVGVRAVECRTYGARDHLYHTQRFRAGLTFGGRPSGPGRSYWVAHSIFTGQVESGRVPSLRRPRDHQERTAADPVLGLRWPHVL
jgi:hypothetical protein